ncbi:MAG: hypothetical protein V7609_2125 [Verrucomicrobiota bacterium]
MISDDGTAVLDRIGLTAGQVRAALARATPLSPERVIQLLSDKKHRYGRRGLPEFIVNAMIAEYRRTNSLAKTALKFNRTRQSMWQILSKRIALNERTRHEAVFYKGEKFTPFGGRGGKYLRRSNHGSDRGEALLHRLVWIEHHGPIPDGHQIMFRDGDRTNCAIENLYCASRIAAATGRPSCNAWTKFRRGEGPKPSLTKEAREAHRCALVRVWASYNRAQKRRRLHRTIHRRWIERRKLAA